MPRVLCVADDLTGAAEIAGIGVDHGLSAWLVRKSDGIATIDVGILCVDTNSRSIQDTHELKRLFQEPIPCEFFYKKTDSALRGNIDAELWALMLALGRPRALLLAQNPSKGRTIFEGVYRIGSVPLHQTDFASDPEFPRRSSRVPDFFDHKLVEVHNLNVNDPLPRSGLVICNAATAKEVDQWAERVDDQTIAAGGADFFQALLRKRGHTLKAVTVPETPVAWLMLCGSASGYSRKMVQEWTSTNQPIAAMTNELFDEPTLAPHQSRWADEIAKTLAAHNRTILAIPQAVSPARSSSLRACMAATIRTLLLAKRETQSLRLYIEGGATAAALVDGMGWREFTVEGNLAPGVVALRPAGVPSIQLAIKPGSYPWPAPLLASLEAK